MSNTQISPSSSDVTKDAPTLDELCTAIGVAVHLCALFAYKGTHYEDMHVSVDLPTMERRLRYLASNLRALIPAK